jgi:DNA/RNA endonuclease YhcR with UshA esterase domain
MRQSGLIIGLALSLALGSAACSRGADDRDAMQQAALNERDKAAGDEITVTGCLTSAADRGAFVVTADRNALTSGALHAGDGETPTYTYELTGNTTDLAQHVGRQVQVTGRVDEDRDDQVKVDQEEKTELPKAQSGDDTVKPAIETETEMDINVRRLHVATVTPTNRACQ